MILLWIHPQHLHKLSHSGIPSHSDLFIILHCILQPLTMLVLLCSCYTATLRGWLSNAVFFKGPWNHNRINLLQGESSTTFFQQKESLSYHPILELTIPRPSPCSLADPQWVQKVKSQVFRTHLIETGSFKLPFTFSVSSLPQKEELVQGGIEQNRHTKPNWRCRFYPVWTACVANRNFTPEKTSVTPPLHRSGLEAGPWLLHNNRKHCRQQGAGCAEAIFSIHARQGM